MEAEVQNDKLSYGMMGKWAARAMRKGTWRLGKEDNELRQSTSEARAPPLLLSCSSGQPVPCTSQQESFPPCSRATRSELDSFLCSFFLVKMLKKKNLL